MPIDDNVVKMPTELTRLFEDAHRALKIGAEGEHKSIESRLLLMVSLAAIKAKFKDNISFGKSCSEHGLGENIVPAHDRAILIQWAEKPEWTRTVLEKTEYKSIRRIHQHDWCVDTGVKTEGVPSSRKTPGGPKLQEAKDKILAYEAVEGKLPPADRHFQMEGVTPSTYDRAIREVRGAREQAGPLKFTKAQDHHFEMRLKIAIKAATEEIYSSYEAEVQKRNKADIDVLFPKLEKIQESAKLAEKYHREQIEKNAVFTEAEYRDLLLCTHEANPSEETRQRAFMVLNAKKFQLTGKR